VGDRTIGASINGQMQWQKNSGVYGGHIIKLNFSSSTKGLGILFSAFFSPHKMSDLCFCFVFS
jgi:hypothetical protein